MWWHRANAAAPCKNAHAMWEPTPCVSAGVLKASTIFDLQWISRWQNGQLIFKYVFGNISECKSGRHNSCDVVKLSYCSVALQLLMLYGMSMNMQWPKFYGCQQYDLSNWVCTVPDNTAVIFIVNCKFIRFSFRTCRKFIITRRNICDKTTEYVRNTISRFGYNAETATPEWCGAILVLLWRSYPRYSSSAIQLRVSAISHHRFANIIYAL